MKYLSAVFLILVVSCTPKLNQEKVNYEEEQILIGEVNWDGLTKEPYASWFTPNYMDYQVDETSLALIEAQVQEVDIVVFLGTWCTDSHVQIPQFYKMMDHVGYDINRIKIVALERLETSELTGLNAEEEGYGISHVPTFIFFKSGKELGRIVEYPNRTIEKDMVEILSTL